MKKTIITASAIAFLVFLLVPIGVNILASITNPYVKGEPNTVEATWISFWGSYLGGFLSALIGAGVSGTVAYFLIGREVEASRNSDTILSFSIKFNEDFQNIKKDIIQSMADMQALLQNYHMILIQDVEFMKTLNEFLEHFKDLQVGLNQTLNTHVLLLQYVKEKNPKFNPNLMCDKYTRLILQYNSLRTKYAKSFDEKSDYDIITDYNNVVINKANELRVSIIEIEHEYIGVLFPAVQTKNKFSLPELEPITKVDYDELMSTYLKDEH